MKESSQNTVLSVLSVEFRHAVEHVCMVWRVQAKGNHFPAFSLNMASKNLVLTTVYWTEVCGY